MKNEFVGQVKKIYRTSPLYHCTLATIYYTPVYTLISSNTLSILNCKEVHKTLVGKDEMGHVSHSDIDQ